MSDATTGPRPEDEPLGGSAAGGSPLGGDGPTDSLLSDGFIDEVPSGMGTEGPAARESDVPVGGGADEVPSSIVPDDLSGLDATAPAGEQAAGDRHPDTLLAEQRLGDLLRERAEFTNYRNRVTREREQDSVRAVGRVVESLLPVLDDIFSARAHGDLAEGPFATIAGKLETILAGHGVQVLDQDGVPFDPTQHEAMMHDPSASAPAGLEGQFVAKVMQPGFVVGERLVRPARVIVGGE